MQARWHFWLTKGKTCFFLFFQYHCLQKLKKWQWSSNCVRGVWHVSRYIWTWFTISSALVFSAISLIFRDISIIITQHQETWFCLTTGCKWELITRIRCFPFDWAYEFIIASIRIYFWIRDTMFNDAVIFTDWTIIRKVQYIIAFNVSCFCWAKFVPKHATVIKFVANSLRTFSHPLSKSTL